MSDCYRPGCKREAIWNGVWIMPLDEKPNYGTLVRHPICYEHSQADVPGAPLRVEEIEDRVAEIRRAERLKIAEIRRDLANDQQRLAV